MTGGAHKGSGTHTGKCGLTHDPDEIEGWDSASVASSGLESDKDPCLDAELDDDEDPQVQQASDYDAWRKKMALEVTI